MSANFTPGPWDCTGCMFPDDDEGGVYYRVQAEGMDARGANARLIAAAPELYEALEELLHQAMQSKLADDPHPWASDALASAEMALRKARGEA